MTLETLMTAIMPSLCVSIIMMVFNRQQAQRDKKNAAIASNKRNSERVQLCLLLAAAKLSYAVAMALKHGHPNGEVEEGVEQYKSAMAEFKKFERELVAERSSE